MKQTAVEWFAETIRTNRKFSWDAIVEQAKEMEKQQIMDAYKQAEDMYEFFEYEHRYGRKYLTAEPYYNETFKTSTPWYDEDKQTAVERYIKQITGR
jgi:hypothetical protein